LERLIAQNRPGAIGNERKAAMLENAASQWGLYGRVIDPQEAEPLMVAPA